MHRSCGSNQKRQVYTSCVIHHTEMLLRFDMNAVNAFTAHSVSRIRFLNELRN